MNHKKIFVINKTKLILKKNNYLNPPLNNLIHQKKIMILMILIKRLNINILNKNKIINSS